jgi:hypothetical protein
MLQTFEAIIDTKGRVHLRESVTLAKKSRAIVIILDEEVPQVEEMSLVGSMQLLDDNLETGITNALVENL